MKILLVRTARIKQAITLADFMFCEPLGLEMVYAALEDAHTLEVFDMMCEEVSLAEKLASFGPDAVAITSLCIDVNAVLDAARITKAYKPEVQVIVGGTQAYLNPLAFAGADVDVIFKFTTGENLRAYFNNGKALPGVLLSSQKFRGHEASGRNEYILPNRRSTSKYRSQYSYFGYKPAAIMQISQGCRKVCRFCLRWRIEGHQEVDFDPELVLKDLQQIPETSVMIYDNDFFGSGERADGFFNLVERHGIKKNFIAYASVEGILAQRDQLSRYRSLGLKALLVGYETFSEDEMKYYTKKATVAQNHEAAALVKQVGIDVWASFMAHPDWDQASFKAFRGYVRSLAPEISSVSPLTPFENLPLYKEYKDRLLFPVEAYEKWSFGQVSIMPGKMSLRAYYLEMMKTNLYINLFLNRPTEMLRKYGIKHTLYLCSGSVKVLIKYMKLIQDTPRQQPQLTLNK